MKIYINTNMEQSQIIDKFEKSVEIWGDFYFHVSNHLLKANLLHESEELEFVHENSNVPGISFSDDCGIPEKKQKKIIEVVYKSLNETLKEEENNYKYNPTDVP